MGRTAAGVKGITLRKDDSVIGMEVGPSLGRFVTGLPKRFTAAKDDVKISGVCVTVDTKNGRAKSIERFRYDFDIEKVDESKIAILGYKPKRASLASISEDDSEDN